MSYLTEDELLAAHALSPDVLKPCVIQDVSHGMLSLARHYGGIKLNGASYTYIPESDELIRDDVLRMVTKMRKRSARRAVPEGGSERQGAGHEARADEQSPLSWS